ncbi:DedA family protein [Paenibacillus cisolokensis]|uniref:DedA family protein n=1 Tax=Paenibacillus cisolokensis TaxID=1658519 RepID=UPI003D2BB5BD
MGYETLLAIVGDWGQYTFFIVLCLGLIGLPIPNEVVVMTAGLLAVSGILPPVPTFAMTTLGIMSGMTFGYSVGRCAGHQFHARLARRKSIGQFLARAQQLGQKYGGYAICLSIFLPLLRHVTPYALGLNHMIYGTFALFAYSSAFIWTSIYFVLGMFVGDRVEEIGQLIYQYGLVVIWILAVGFALFMAVKYFSVRRKAKSKSQ